MKEPDRRSQTIILSGPATLYYTATNVQSISSLMSYNQIRGILGFTVVQRSLGLADLRSAIHKTPGAFPFLAPASPHQHHGQYSSTTRLYFHHDATVG